jgi:hypothetical protein
MLNDEIKINQIKKRKKKNNLCQPKILYQTHDSDH